MGTKPFGVHQIQGNKVEAIQAMQYATGQTFILGAVLQSTGGEVIVSVADPASGTVVGVALQGAATNPGYDAANSPATFTGRRQTVSVCRPNDETIFVGQLTNGSSALVTPAIADVEAQYGITAYSGIWTVDKAKTGGSARVNVVGFDADLKQVFFKWISSFLAG